MRHGYANGRERASARHCDLKVLGAQKAWTQIRWALFVFPDITDVAPTADPDVVRIFYEGACHATVWRVELLQAGFDVPEIEPPRPSLKRVAAAAGSPMATTGRPAPTPLRSAPSRRDRRRHRS